MCSHCLSLLVETAMCVCADKARSEVWHALLTFAQRIPLPSRRKATPALIEVDVLAYCVYDPPEGVLMSMCVLVEWCLSARDFEITVQYKVPSELR